MAPGDPLRYEDDPGFAAFCRKVGLPAPDSLAALRLSHSNVRYWESR